MSLLQSWGADGEGSNALFENFYRGCVAAAALQQWCMSRFQGHFTGKHTFIGNIELSLQ